MTTSTSGPAADSLDDLNGQRGPASTARALTPEAATSTAAASGPTAGTSPMATSAPSPAAAPGAARHTPGTAVHAPGHAQRHRPVVGTVASDLRPRSKRRRLLLLVPILLVVVVVAAALGYRYWYESTYFVSTDNASITGDLVQVGSLNAGRIVATRVDVGRTVQAGQEIAIVAMPQEVGSTVQGAGPKMGVTGTTDTLVSVYAPLTGVVAARMGYVGGTVAAGQPIYALVNPAQVWVRANIEESSAWRVQVGQPAQIHVDALNRDFTGHVDAITPASAATFSLLPSSNASGNFTKVTQYVPVKIVVDAPGVVLPLGTSVEVRIHVREPSSAFPLPWQP